MLRSRCVSHYFSSICHGSTVASLLSSSTNSALIHITLPPNPDCHSPKRFALQVLILHPTVGSGGRHIRDPSDASDNSAASTNTDMSIRNAANPAPNPGNLQFGGDPINPQRRRKRRTRELR